MTFKPTAAQIELMTAAQNAVTLINREWVRTDRFGVYAGHGGKKSARVLIAAGWLIDTTRPGDFTQHVTVARD